MRKTTQPLVAPPSPRILALANSLYAIGEAKIKAGHKPTSEERAIMSRAKLVLADRKR